MTGVIEFEQDSNSWNKSLNKMQYPNPKQE